MLVTEIFKSSEAKTILLYFFCSLSLILNEVIAFLRPFCTFSIKVSNCKFSILLFVLTESQWSMTNPSGITPLIHSHSNLAMYIATFWFNQIFIVNFKHIVSLIRH